MTADLTDATTVRSARRKLDNGGSIATGVRSDRTVRLVLTLSDGHGAFRDLTPTEAASLACDLTTALAALATGLPDDS